MSASGGAGPRRERPDTVGSLLAAIANALQDGRRMLMFADKRGWGPDEFEQVRALDEALDRLTAAEPQVAELVKLRYFAGLSIPQAAATLGISPRTADTWWAYARAWLLGELEDGDD